MSSNYELLCQAASDGDVELVEFLLNDGKVDPNPSVPTQESALSIACRNKNLDIVRMLVTNQQHPADPNQPDSKDYTPFVIAVTTRDMDLIKLLLNESIVKVNLNYISFRFTILTKAIDQENVTLVEFLLKAGADPNLKPKTKHSLSPFYVAVWEGNIAICRVMLENGYDSNTVMCEDNIVWTGIHLAARLNRLQIVQLLLAKGADIISSKRGALLFKQAVIGDNRDILEHCLQHIYNRLGDRVQWDYWSEQSVTNAILKEAKGCVSLLLHWGFLSKPQKVPNSDCNSLISAFEAAARVGDIKSIMLLVRFKPQYLQESWLVNGEIPAGLRGHETFTAQLLETRRQHQYLKDLCRTKVFHGLGYNPMSKAEKLPLPRTLKEFIKFKDNEGFDASFDKVSLQNV